MGTVWFLIADWRLDRDHWFCVENIGDRYYRAVKILHAMQTLDPASGGPPQVVTRLAAAQAGLGHDVTIITSHQPDRAEAIADSISGLPHADRFKIETVPMTGFGTGLFSRKALSWARQNLDGTDFVHLHSMWSPIPHAVAWACRGLGVPYTLCPHGMLDTWSMQQSTLRKKAHLATLGGRTMRGAAFIHALNSHEAKIVSDFGFGTRVEVINNGVFLEEFADLPSPGTFRRAYPGLGDGPLIVFLSRLHHKKGLDHLAGGFAAMADRFSDARLVVVGPDGGARDDFQDRIKRAGLSDRVLLTGSMYGPEKLAALVDAACYCLPSRQEGFSIAICEALACGVPVVISPECHFDEVEESGAGLVVPREDQALGDALAAVLGDKSRADEMGRRGRSLIAERFTWPVIAKKSIELYQGAIL